MRKTVKYKCEYCGKEMRNKLEMEKHETVCKVTTTAENVYKKRILALFKQLHKNGFFVSVHWDGVNQQHIMVVYDPTHKFDK